MVKVLSVSDSNYIVKVSNDQTTWGTITLDPASSLNGDAGQVVIEGDLIVKGKTKSQSEVTTFDTVIELNSDESPLNAGISAGESGIEINRGGLPNAKILFSEYLEGNQIEGTNDFEQGAFVLINQNGTLPLYTSKVSNTEGNNLILIGSGEGIVTVEGTVNYEQQIFHYNAGIIDNSLLFQPKDPDALVNAQAMIDFVTSYNESNYLEQIIALSNPDTKVIAETIPFDMVRIQVNNQNIAIFTETESQFEKVLIKDEITTEAGQNLVLNPSLNVSVSGKRITNVADPIDPYDAVNLRSLEETALGALLGVDLSSATTGSLLIYNAETGQFEVSDMLINQEIDAGVY